MAEQRSAEQIPQQFEEILERYGSFLRGAIAQMCPRDLGLQFDDIEQDARLRLWRALQSETEIEKPASYLYRVAASATLDAVRRVTARREELLGLTGPEPAANGSADPIGSGRAEGSPEQRIHQRILLDEVQGVLRRMSAAKRCAVSLHIRGFTPEEIGGLLRWSEARARSLVYRGLKELRARLAAEGIEYEG